MTDMSNREMMEGFSERSMDLGGQQRSSPQKKYMRLKDAAVRYSVCRTRITQIAKEAGALIKIGGTILIDVEAFDKFIETFRIRGGSKH